MRYSREAVASGVRHLRAVDPVMRGLIRQVGPFTLRPERDRFGLLVRSILSQQISTAAARSIRARLEALTAPQPSAPAQLMALSDAQLRSAGLSPQKMASLRDLCEKVLEGHVRLPQIGRKADEAVIEELVQVRGIGRWTAQMFLIFGLGRLDVFPHDDLGVRTALRDLYGLPELPDRAASDRVAGRWRPYASVATWYCWRSGDIRHNRQNAHRGYPV